MATEPSNRQSDRAQSLFKGLIVLQSFSEGRQSMSLTEVAEQVGMNRATTRRFLLTLVDLGYLTQEGKRYTLTPKVMTLGYNYLSNQPWWKLANPVAEDISRELKESCSIGVLSNDQLIFVARAQGPRAMTINLSPGRVVPVHTAGIGRVLLAEMTDTELEAFFERNPPVPLTRHTVTDPVAIRTELQTVRRQGYSIVDQELDEGLLAIAVPIRDSRGKAVAALGISTQAQRHTYDDLRNNFLPVLLDGGERIHRLL